MADKRYKLKFQLSNGNTSEVEFTAPQGEQGVSPTITASKSGKVTTLTIKDATGTKTTTVNDGADGKTPVPGVDYFTEADKEEFLNEMDAVRYVEQTLTEEQKAQARKNIGVDGPSVENVLLGQTPLKLTEAVTQLQLIGDGECTYSLLSDTVADLSTATMGAPEKATLTKTDSLYELEATSNVTAWYEPFVDITFTGLTVGESYALVVDCSGCLFESNNTTSGTGILYDGSGGTIKAATAYKPTRNTTNFTASTTSVRLRYYVAGNYHYQRGYTKAQFANVYINRAGTTNVHSTPTNTTGSFTDSVLLPGVSAGVTVDASPACYVYAVIVKEEAKIAKSRHGGKICVCFGDSVTGNTAAPSDYPSVISEETGMTVVNAGFGGCRMSDTHTTAAYAAFSMVKLADAVASGDWSLQDENVSGLSSVTNGAEHLATLKEVDWSSVDFVTIAYGTNDIQSAVGIDNVSNPQDTKKYLGALRYAITKILTAYPHIKMLLLTPIYRYWNDENIDSDSKMFNGGTQHFTEWGDGLLEVAEEYKIPAVDMYRTLGFNSITRTYYFPSNDGTHPNAKGLKVIGGKIAAKLLSEY